MKVQRMFLGSMESFQVEYYSKRSPCLGFKSRLKGTKVHLPDGNIVRIDDEVGAEEAVTRAVHRWEETAAKKPALLAQAITAASSSESVRHLAFLLLKALRDRPQAAASYADALDAALEKTTAFR